MTKQEIIEELRTQAQHFRISKEELVKECEEHGIELYEDVLSPIGFNTCDRCGEYGDSELDLFWIDGFDFEEDNPKDKALLNGIAKEKQDYCEVCWECVRKLQEIGEEK